MEGKRGMHDRWWFFTYFKKSISMRKGRVVIASFSVTLAVAVVTAMTVVTAGISRKLGDELKVYGANLIVSPLEAGRLDEESIRKIMKIDHVVDVSGQILTQVFVRDQTVEVIGLDIPSLKSKGWRLYGEWPEKKGEILAGINLKEAIGLSEGDSLSVGSQAGEKEYIVTGFIEIGGFEDSALIASLHDARAMSVESSTLSTILVRGEPGELEKIVQDIQKTVDDVEVKTLRQVAVAEQALLAKMKLLMALVTVVILLASGISVASTMGASVLERREEIGLMKAIGATSYQIRILFMSETAFIGFIGGIAGFIVGSGAAQIISQGAFDSYLVTAYYVPVISLLSGLVLSLIAGHFPVRDAMKYNPAQVLRGE
jgi:putative ABC transport system permease protein